MARTRLESLVTVSELALEAEVSYWTMLRRLKDAYRRDGGRGRWMIRVGRGERHILVNRSRLRAVHPELTERKHADDADEILEEIRMLTRRVNSLAAKVNQRGVPSRTR